jgi:hypothetical protein
MLEFRAVTWTAATTSVPTARAVSHSTIELYCSPAPLFRFWHNSCEMGARVIGIPTWESVPRNHLPRTQHAEVTPAVGWGRAPAGLSERRTLSPAGAARADEPFLLEGNK